MGKTAKLTCEQQILKQARREFIQFNKAQKRDNKIWGVNKQIKKIEKTITSDIKFLEKDTINITFTPLHI
jgi:hypothetical protein